MKKPVKRRYDNSRRQALVRVTKAYVVEVAGVLFVERGYASTTIEAIAEASKVPLATVYRLFESKLGIFKAVLDTSFVGDDRPVALHDRPTAKAAAAQTDPKRFLEGYARLCREVLDRSGAIQHVLRGAAAVDPEVAELLATISRQRYEGQSRVARGLVERRALAPGLLEKDAADMIYALMSPELHHVFSVERRWSADRYERWLARTLCQSLLKPPPA